MLVKIAIIILLIVVLFGCNDGGAVSRSPVSFADENVSVSTVGGKQIYRSRYISLGMTYEVIYIIQDHLETTAIEMQVINLTQDSINIEATRRALQ